MNWYLSQKHASASKRLMAIQKLMAWVKRLGWDKIRKIIMTPEQKPVTAMFGQKSQRWMLITLLSIATGQSFQDIAQQPGAAIERSMQLLQAISTCGGNASCALNIVSKDIGEGEAGFDHISDDPNALETLGPDDFQQLAPRPSDQLQRTEHVDQFNSATGPPSEMNLFNKPYKQDVSGNPIYLTIPPDPI